MTQLKKSVAAIHTIDEGWPATIYPILIHSIYQPLRDVYIQTILAGEYSRFTALFLPQNRLLARLYQGGHFRPRNFMRFQGAICTDPDLRY